MSTTSQNNTRVARLSTETKAAFKTTEFIAYVVILVSMFIASIVVDSNEDPEGFGPQQVWLYAVLLTIGYMISRGLAKSGSREYYDRDRDDRDERAARR
jgi:hypothetical protein